MIVMRYSGGLGNQMFQYAMSIVLSQYFPHETILADLSRYSFINEHEGFVLDKYFNIEIKALDDITSKKLNCIKYFLMRLPLKNMCHKFPIDKIEKYDEWIEKKDKRIGIITDYTSTIFNQDAFHLNYEICNTWHFKGNWMNPLYWSGYENNVFNAFCFKEDFLSLEDKSKAEEIEKKQSVGIHIRKGDYIGKSGFDLCGNYYYRNALDRLTDIIGNKDIYVYIFSDSPNVDLSFLHGIHHCMVLHPNKSGIDMWMMSKCRYNIIANSTFSYWSALINKHKEKIIIAPRYDYRRKDFYRILPVPSNWIQINNLLI